MRGRRVLAAAVLCTAVVLPAGCGREDIHLGPAARVQGRVTVDGNPLSAGRVTFHPDAAKGNATPHRPSANVVGGRYDLFTVGQTAAPLGWYKVTVEASQPAGPVSEDDKQGRVPVVARRYAAPATTPLAVEVVESPAGGAYDLAVEKFIPGKK